MAVWEVASGRLLTQPPQALAFRPTALSFSPTSRETLAASGPAGVLFITLREVHDVHHVVVRRGRLDGSPAPPPGSAEEDVYVTAPVAGRDLSEVEPSTGLVDTSASATKGLAFVQAFVAASERAGTVAPFAAAALPPPPPSAGTQRLLAASTDGSGLPDLQAVGSGAEVAELTAAHAESIAQQCVLDTAWGQGGEVLFAATAAGTVVTLSPRDGSRVAVLERAGGSSGLGSHTPAVTALALTADFLLLGTSEGQLILRHAKDLSAPPFAVYDLLASPTDMGLPQSLCATHDVPGHALHRAVAQLSPDPAFEELFVGMANGAVLGLPLSIADPPVVEEDEGGAGTSRGAAASARGPAPGTSSEPPRTAASAARPTSASSPLPAPSTVVADGHCGAVLGVVPVPAPRDAAKAQRGCLVATASTDGTLRVWDAAAGRQLAKCMFLDVAPAETLQAAGLLPDTEGSEASPALGGASPAALLAAGVPRSVLVRLQAWDSLSGLPSHEDFASVLEEDAEAEAARLLSVVEEAQGSAVEDRAGAAMAAGAPPGTADAAKAAAATEGEDDEEEGTPIVAPLTCIAAHPRLPIIAVGSATGRVRILALVPSPREDRTGIYKAGDVGSKAAAPFTLVPLLSDWVHEGGVSGIAFSSDPTVPFMASFSAAAGSVVLHSLSLLAGHAHLTARLSASALAVPVAKAGPCVVASATLAPGTTPTSIAWQYPASVPLQEGGPGSTPSATFPAAMAQLIVSCAGDNSVVTLPVPSGSFGSTDTVPPLPHGAPAGLTGADLVAAGAPRAVDLTPYARQVRGEWPSTPLQVLPTSCLAVGALSGLIEVAYEEEEGKEGAADAGPSSLVPMELALAVMPGYAALPLLPLAWEGLVYAGRDSDGTLQVAVQPLDEVGQVETASDLGSLADGVTELVPWEQWSGAHDAGIMCVAVAGGASHGGTASFQSAKGAPSLVVATGDAAGLAVVQCVAFPAAARPSAAEAAAASGATSDAATQVLAASTIAVHARPITGATFTVDGKVLVTATADGSLGFTRVQGSSLAATGVTGDACILSATPVGPEGDLLTALHRAAEELAPLMPPAPEVALAEDATSAAGLASPTPATPGLAMTRRVSVDGRGDGGGPGTPGGAARQTPPTTPLVREEGPLAAGTERAPLLARIAASTEAAISAAGSAAKAEALAELAALKGRLDAVLAANEAAPELERLSRDEFVVDLVGAADHRASAAAAAEARRGQLQVRISYLMALAGAITREVWDSMETPASALVGMARPLTLRSFPLPVLGHDEERVLDRVTLLRRLEQADMAGTVDAEPAGPGRHGLLHAPVWRGLLTDLPHDMSWVTMAGLLPAALNPAAVTDSAGGLAVHAERLRIQLAASGTDASQAGQGRQGSAALPLNPEDMNPSSALHKVASGYWDALRAAAEGKVLNSKGEVEEAAAGGGGAKAAGGVEDGDEADGIGAAQDWRGADIVRLLYHPAAVRSPAQRRTQILLVGALVRAMHASFNDVFAQLAREKADDVARVAKLNGRIKELAATLGAQVDISTPGSSPAERPEEVLQVTQAEIGFEPYVSDAERAAAAEREAAAAAAAAANRDTAPTRALDDMMHGTLASKDPLDIMAEELGPKPECMVEAEGDGPGPETWTEDQRREAEAWSAGFAELQEAREQRRKEQEAEMRKLLQDVQDVFAAFDTKLARAVRHRAQIAASSAALELYCLRLAEAVADRDDNVAMEGRIIAWHAASESAKVAAAEAAADFQGSLTAQQSALNAAREADRAVERGIRDALKDASPTPLDRETLTPLLAAFKLRKHDPAPLLPGAAGEAAARAWAVEHGMAGAVTEDHTHTDSRDPYAASASELSLPPLSEIRAAVEAEANQPLSEEDLPDGLAVGDSLHPDVWAALQRERAAKVASELQFARLSREVSDMTERFSLLMDDYHRQARYVEALTAHFTTLLAEREVSGCDALLMVQLPQGLDEATDDAPYCDYSSCILLPRRVVEVENARVVRQAGEKAVVLREQLDFHAQLAYMQWTLTYLRALGQDAQEYFTDMQLLRVTKELQEFIKGGDPVDKQRRDLARIEARGKHSASAHTRTLAKLRRSAARLAAQVADKQAENDQLAAHHAELQAAVSVREGILHSKTGGLGNTVRRVKAQQSRKFKAVAARRALAEKARKQAGELADLRAEVDRLRRKTFPSFDQQPGGVARGGAQ